MSRRWNRSTYLVWRSAGLIGRNRIFAIGSGMSGVSLPVTRPTGRALIVGSAAGRAQPVSVMQGLGFGCVEFDDPYAAMVELCRRPLVYRAIILGLTSLYREELYLIDGVKRRYPHVEVWLTQTDGRQAALAEAMRLGADGLLAEDGLHRIALSAASPLSPGDRPTSGLSSLTAAPPERNGSPHS